MFPVFWLVKTLVPRGWCHENVYFAKYNFLWLLLIFTFQQLCGYLQRLYRLANLPKPQLGVSGNCCWSSFRRFSFSFEEICVAERQFVLLEICDALSARPGHFSLNRAFVNAYLIVKWHSNIYRQLDCHFKRFYCFNLIIWISQTNRFVMLNPSSLLVCSRLIIHGQT